MFYVDRSRNGSGLNKPAQYGAELLRRREHGMVPLTLKGVELRVGGVSCDLEGTIEGHATIIRAV
jgi:hypothetical protein